jgi:hypothetical protein
MATVGQGDDGTWSADAAADEIPPDTDGSPSVTTPPGAHRVASGFDVPPFAPISVIGPPPAPAPLSAYEAVLPPVLPRPRRAPDTPPPVVATPAMTAPTMPSATVPAGPVPRPDVPVPPGPGLGAQASAGTPLDPGWRQPSSGDVVDAEIVGPQPPPTRRASKFEQQDTDEWILPTEPEVDPPPPTLEEITALFPTVRSGPSTLPSDTWSGAPTRQLRHLHRRGSLVGWVVGIVALLVVSGAGVALYLDWGSGEQPGASAPLPLGTSDPVTVLPTTLAQLDPAMSSPAASNTTSIPPTGGPKPTATTPPSPAPAPTVTFNALSLQAEDVASPAPPDKKNCSAKGVLVTGSLAFTNITVPAAGTYLVRVWYTPRASGTGRLRVNGVQQGPTLSASFCNGSDPISITLKAGSNSITIERVDGWALFVDKIEVSHQPPSWTP